MHNVIQFPAHRVSSDAAEVQDGGLPGVVYNLDNAYREGGPARVQAVYSEKIYPDILHAWTGLQTVLRRLGKPEVLTEAAYAYPQDFPTVVGRNRIAARMRIYGHMLTGSVKAIEAIHDLSLPISQRTQAVGDAALWECLEGATISYGLCLNTRSVQFPELIRPGPQLKLKSVEAVLHEKGSVRATKEHFAKLGAAHAENFRRWAGVVAESA